MANPDFAHSGRDRSLNRAEVTLNQVESRLRMLLLDVVDFIQANPLPSGNAAQAQTNPEQLANTPLQLRFTGGWVRDKLLDVESHDIDVAISSMTGYQFGLRLKEYLDRDENAEKHGLNDAVKKAGSLAKIEANPEKSKHLETVTTRIMGLDIDLVNLRKETYSDDSRNPQMEFGTPEEDALRRDATINAMFYNLHSQQVEDFTGKGLHDLAAGIIRTPLEPLETFRDDPLRVLRLIRFASRLGYDVDNKAREAMCSPEIKSALTIKITKERVWLELEKMLRGRDPRSALQYINDLGLYDAIFCDPSSSSIYPADTTNLPRVYATLDRLIREDMTNKVIQSAVIDGETRFQAWYLSAFIPFADAPEPPPMKSGKRSLPLAAMIAREGLKSPNKLTDLLTSAVWHLNDIDTWTKSRHWPRDTLGMAVRQWGSTWRMQVLFAMLYKILEDPEAEEAIIERFDKFMAKIKDLDLLDVCNTRPLLDGKQLSSILKTPPGPWMKPALDVILAWQLRNPENSDVTKALEEVQSSGVLEESNNSKDVKATKRGAKGELIFELTRHFLDETLRPLFQQNRTSELTPAGHRRLKQNSVQTGNIDISGVAPIWKVQWVMVESLLSWICQNLTLENVATFWGLLMPPILTIVDDVDVSTRAVGARLLGEVLAHTSPDQLQRTGLTPVFQKSLMSNLSYLPSLTAAEDTVTIFRTTIPALLTLSDKQTDNQSSLRNSTKPSMRPNHIPPKTQILDQVMREGILRAYTFAGENIKIAEMLLTQLRTVANAMGIETVKHLKEIHPLLSDILSDPLATAYPPLLIEAASTIIVVILKTWPRVDFWRAEILRGLSICWLRISEEEDQASLEAVEDKLLECAQALSIASDQAGVFAELLKDVETLIEADQRLGRLFQYVLDGEDGPGVLDV